MKTRRIPLLAVFFLIASQISVAQVVTPGPTPTPAPTLPPGGSTTQTKNCPGNTAGCQGDCIFTITVSSEAGDSCEANRVDVTFQANSTGSACVADFNRSDGGEISFVLCSGDSCSLDDSVFPDDSFWPPYVEGDGRPKPAGKDSLSQECFDAIGLRLQQPGPPFRLFVYRFTGVSSLNPDFGMETLCICNGDTINDTIIVAVDTVKAVVVDEDPFDNSVDDVKGTNNKTAGDGVFATGSTFVVSNIYPNPTSNELNVVFQAYEAGHVQVLVHNQMGQRVKQSIEMLDVGDNLYTLDVSDLQQGFYFMTLIGPYDEKVVLKFIHR